ncbi:MAG: hypothetical protein PWQ38_879 [Proteiniphilum sp.]|nr:hypothetical protein [Proteiniphilum sp.]
MEKDCRDLSNSPHNIPWSETFYCNMKIVKMLLILLLQLSICNGIHAQHHKLQHRPYADQQLFHLGFTIGLHTQDLILTHSGYRNENGEVWFSEIPDYSPGFTVGMIGDYRLSRNLNLRLLPTLNLGSKSFLFREQSSGEEFATTIRNNYITLPFHLKISTARINNFRPYFLLGGYGSMELASQKNKAVRLKPFDTGVEIGTGCSFYLPLFTISPELKFSFGLTDLLEKERTDLKDEELLKYSRSLLKATQRMITLSFHFE